MSTPQIEVLHKRCLARAADAIRRRRKGEHCGHEAKRAMYLAKVAWKLLNMRRQNVVS